MARENRSSIRFGSDKRYSLDKQGFLDPPDQWDEAFAQGMALKLGIVRELSEEHWSFVRYLRDKFLREQTVPPVVTACMDNNLRLNRLKALFPTGYHRGACRIAGINYAFMSRVNIWLTYESYTTLKMDYRLTPTGFLEDFHQWNHRFAHIVVHESSYQGPLIEKHFQVLDYLREFFARRRDIPSVFEMCKANRIDLSDLKALFPDGYRRGACRAAGLPFFG